MSVKAMLFTAKLRSRIAERITRDLRQRGARRASLGGMAISFTHADNEAVRALKAKFEEHRMEQRRSGSRPLCRSALHFVNRVAPNAARALWVGRYYCYVLQGLFEVRRTHTGLRVPHRNSTLTDCAGSSDGRSKSGLPHPHRC
jgi:hypothetical protein